MDIKKFNLSANCYVVSFENGECFAVDIGMGGEMVLDYIKENNLLLKAILITHGHFDHIGGTENIRLATGATVYVSQEDSPMLTSDKLNLAEMALKTVEPVKEFKILNNSLVICGEVIAVYKTPGHTLGSVCFQLGKYLFTGDTLFKGGIGRTDFPNGDFDTIQKSLQFLKNLDGNLSLLAGHGENTTLEYERKHNRFINWY
ncbi:MBL fold hydrolase [Clostridia bacterium]|nr:MBL fold hydrolase [Clostridia bacterium]